MFATINSNDKLEFIFTNETNEIIEDYIELNNKRDTHPITSVLVATSEDLETAGAVLKDEALIEQYGEHWLKIYSYGFAYSTIKCQQLVEAIFNQVKGFGYSSFKSEYSFLPYLSLGDKIKLKNKDGSLVNSIVLRYETNYDEITFEAPSIINASVDYELPETPEIIAKKAVIIADQANSKIASITTQTEEINVTVNNNYQELQKKFDGYTPIEKTVALETSVVRLQTDTYTKTQIDTKLIDGSVTKVLSTSGTFDMNGLTIEQTNAKTKGNFNATGLKIIDNTSSIGETLLFAGYDESREETVVETANINVSHYLVIGTNSRLEDYEDGTGVFDI